MSNCRRYFALFAGLAVLAAGCGEQPVSLGPTSLVERTLFTSGEGGYHTYRIPSLLCTQASTLLAFVEGRRNSRRDEGDIDILLRRSVDGGRTWSSPQVVVDFGRDTCGNPTVLQDRNTGTIWLAFCGNLAEDTGFAVIGGRSRDTRRAYVTASTDEGLTWSLPREITNQVKAPDMRWYATGPGIGIQISSGPHRGRIIVPGDHSYPEAGGDISGVPAAYGSHMIYSDDHGLTWQLGGIIRPRVGEPQVAELGDGHGGLLANLRAFSGRGRRAQAISNDGDTTWSQTRDHDRLVEPVCQASLLRYSWPGEQTGDLLLFCNPASRRRENLVVRASGDGGNTWRRARIIHAGPAAYSCLARMPNGDVGCLYEAGDTALYERIVLAVFPVAAVVGAGDDEG